MIVAAMLCAVMTLLPPIIGFAAFFAFAAVVRYHPSQSLSKRWLVYGALGGACIFFAAAMFAAYYHHEIPMAYYGLPPNKWFRIAFRFSFPLGGFVGSLIGYGTARLIRGVPSRGVRVGAGIGFAVAVIATAVYVAWLVHSLRGQFIKYPSVIVVLCCIVLLLLLTIGGVSGTIMGAIVSRLRRRYKAGNVI